MPITRTDEYERLVDNSPIAEAYARRLAYPNPYSQPKMSVQEYVDLMINKAGMREYIQMVNSELDSPQKKEAGNKIKSILEIPDIKNAIDKAIDTRKYSNPTPLLASLESMVKTDSNIPEEMKNVMGNEELRKYIEDRMGIGSQEKTKYHLLGEQESDVNKLNETKPAFNFEYKDI